jgi:hypothetical protein
MNGKRIAFSILRPVLSLVAGIIPFISMSSMLPAGMLPEGTMSLLGPIQSLSGSVDEQIINVVNPVFPIGSFLPLLVGGGSGVIVWMVISRILGTAENAMNSSSISNPDDMMKKFGMNIPSFSTQFNTNTPVPKLPDDITKIQYTVLKLFHQGYKNSKDIAKQLSMDNKEVQKQWDALITSGYLTKDKKMTSKAIELVT